MQTFEIVLHKTYYNQGFFNVNTRFDSWFGSGGVPIEIRLRDSGTAIQGMINRTANSNGTPRIMGGSLLRAWFQENFQIGDRIKVEIVSPVTIRLVHKTGRRPESEHESPLGSGNRSRQQSEAARELQPPNADDLSRWRRSLVQLLGQFESQDAGETPAAKIGRLSRQGFIPRHMAALMKVVTEARNASEYEARNLSPSEGAAVKKAWEAVVEWANHQRLRIDAHLGPDDPAMRKKRETS